MKNVAKIVRSFNVETPVVNLLFISYFVLLIFSASFIIRKLQQDEMNATATSDVRTEMNVQVRQ